MDIDDDAVDCDEVTTVDEFVSSDEFGGGRDGEMTVG